MQKTKKPKKRNKQDATLTESDIKRFWSYVDKTSSCWIWTGAKGKGRDTYGRFNVRGYVFKASRLSYLIEKGPIPEGLHVLHSCDVPSCVNPSHLEVGTHVENMAAMKARCRSNGRLRGIKICTKGLHPLEGDNLIICKNGRRLCKVCRQAIQQKHNKIVSERRNANGYWKKAWAIEKEKRKQEKEGSKLLSE